MTGDALLDFVNNKLFPTLKGLNVTAATPIKKAIVKTTFEDANNYMKDGVLLRQVINIIDDLDLDDYEESHAFGEIYESILRELQSAGSSGEFYTPRAVTDFMAKTIKPQLGEKVADFACGTGGFLTSWLNELSKQKTSRSMQPLFMGLRRNPSLIHFASRTCCCTALMFRWCIMKTHFCGMCLIIPRKISSM
jgi:type I restriction enzyme M protein